MTEINIDELDVSDSWKKKFKKFGGEGKNKKDLNIFAFIFGPFYYFAKKMWFKGAFLLGALTLLNIALIIVESVKGAPFHQVIYFFPGAVICSLLANNDYYKHVVYKEKMYKPFSAFSKPILATAFPIVSILLSVGISAFTQHTERYETSMCENSVAKGVVVKLTNEEFIKKVGVDSAKAFNYSVENISTIRANEEVGVYECSAELNVTRDDGISKLMPITYTVELTDDRKNINVSVSGL